jgi:hypothetical protein
MAPIVRIIRRIPLIDGMSDAGKSPTDKTEGRIELSGVHFAYPSRPDVEVCKVRDATTITHTQCVVHCT